MSSTTEKCGGEAVTSLHPLLDQQHAAENEQHTHSSSREALFIKSVLWERNLLITYGNARINKKTHTLLSQDTLSFNHIMGFVEPKSQGNRQHLPNLTLAHGTEFRRSS